MRERVNSNRHLSPKSFLKPLKFKYIQERNSCVNSIFLVMCEERANHVGGGGATELQNINLRLEGVEVRRRELREAGHEGTKVL